MNQDVKKTCKEKQQRLDHPPSYVQQPSSLLSSSEQGLIQEQKTLKLTQMQLQYVQQIQPANSATIASTEQALVAQLRLMTPKERVQFFGKGPVAKKGKKEHRAGWFFAPPGPSPLRPGETPYQIVEKAVKRVNEYLNLSSSSLTSEDAAKPRIVEVILKLNQYIECIPRNLSDNEMDAALREFQRDVGVDEEEISWYNLMNVSNVAFWNSLANKFIPSTPRSTSQRSRSRKKKRVNRNPDPQTVKAMLLEPNKTTYLRSRPSNPNPYTQIDPPEPRMNCEAPYVTVKKALTFLKSELGLTRFDPNPNYMPWKISGKSCSTVDEVIMELDEYVDSIAKTSSSEEMKALLMLFQIRVGLPTWPLVYNVLWFSPLDLLNYLGAYFVREDDGNGDDEPW